MIESRGSTSNLYEMLLSLWSVVGELTGLDLDESPMGGELLLGGLLCDKEVFVSEGQYCFERIQLAIQKGMLFLDPSYR